MTYKNKNNGKLVSVTRTGPGFIWFMIDGIEDVLRTEIFEAIYEKQD